MSLANKVWSIALLTRFHSRNSSDGARSAAGFMLEAHGTSSMQCNRQSDLDPTSCKLWAVGPLKSLVRIGTSWIISIQFDNAGKGSAHARLHTKVCSLGMYKMKRASRLLTQGLRLPTLHWFQLKLLSRVH